MNMEVEDVANLELDDNDHLEHLEIIFENKTKITIYPLGRIEIQPIQKELVKES